MLVANDTRVMAARLFGRRATGGRVELLVLEAVSGPVRVLARPARKLKVGEQVQLDGGGAATILGPGDAPGQLLVQFDAPVDQVLEQQGQMPLPPYLGRAGEADDRERYQTVYAGPLGAAAAPTAGLHFTRELIDRLGELGVGFATVTLHVGLGTFRPLTDVDIARGTLHSEVYSVPETTAELLREARTQGGRVIAVGTTSARTLEAATPYGEVSPCAGSGVTDIFVRPPYDFRSLDGLITNFHLPRSSLLMLVAALCGRDRLFSAYSEAVTQGYRFYSYGDAMLLL